MKVSVDALLGSADRMRSQRQQEENARTGRKNDISADSVTISSRISTRLDGMENEFRSIQSSLTKNQIIRDGLDQLRQDVAAGGADQQHILGQVNFEGEPVLSRFVGDQLSAPQLKDLSATNAEMITGDMERLRRLQVELDNIVASNLISEDKAAVLIQNVEASIARTGNAGLETISSVQPDAVMRLTR